MAEAIQSPNPSARKPLTQQRLKELLHYDPETGVFTWRVDMRCGKDHNRVSVRAGSVAGCQTRYGKSMYVEVRIDGRKHLGHRLAFLYVEGKIPRLVDHGDTDGINNKWQNLRPCTRSTNGMNRGTPANNTSGFKGVSQDRRSGRWDVYITRDGRRKYLGQFDAPEDGAAVYAKAAAELHREFARVS